MRVRLPHVHRVRKRLADGRTVTYYYHRLTRRRIHGEPGTPEFLESYREASRPSHDDDGTLAAIIGSYKRSHEFAALSPRTRSDYDRFLAAIERTFGDAPIEVLEDVRFRSVALKERDRIAASSRRAADYWWSVLRRVLSWAQDRGVLSRNVCTGGGRLYRADRRDRIWTVRDIEAFLAVASDEMRLAMALALFTGQRKADILSLRWSAWDGDALRFRQSKTGAEVIVPAVRHLRDAIEHAPRNAETILTGRRGAPYTTSGFDTVWRRTCRAAGITGLSFHDLRGTLLTMLAEAGCTEAEIAAISGHRIGHGTAMDGYLSRTERLARSAMDKLETYLTTAFAGLHFARK